MPEILKQYSLKNLNTFGLDVRAAAFIACKSSAELVSVITDRSLREKLWLVLGEGSNILFTGDFEGLVIRPAIMGKEIVSEDRGSVKVLSGAGENWDEFVAWAVNWGFGGIENLSLIPGTVGSSPIQNIGAYGIEAGHCIEEVHALDMESGRKLVFSNESCRFGYRDSIFKREWKDRCIITSVLFRLSKQPRLQLGYDRLAEMVTKRERKDIQGVREAVIEIRRSKLPDPKVLGNAGSFFKNPVIPGRDFNALQRQFPDIPSYPAYKGQRKVPAAWLIEECGWKGKRIGDAGTYEKQALVIVNHGKAEGRDLIELAEMITEDVEHKFGIRLTREVNVV